MFYRLQLTSDENVGIFDVNYITGTTKGYTLPPGVFELRIIVSCLGLYFLMR